MNTPVKRDKSTALGKKYNPSHGPNKHRKGPYLPKWGYRVSKKKNMCVCVFVHACVRACVCMFNSGVNSSHF